MGQHGWFAKPRAFPLVISFIALISYGMLLPIDAANDELALIGATIYTTPSALAIRNGVVLISGNTITKVGTKSQVNVPASAQVLDCTGRVVVAGLWNSHVHFMERKWTEAETRSSGELNQQFRESFTQYGFTTVFDLSSPWENTQILRRRATSAEIQAPRIFSTGLGMLPANARLPSEAVIQFMGWVNPRAPVLEDAATATAVVKRATESDVDGIKLFASVPPGAQLSPCA